jgi:ATP-dependent Clp protease ATP-binding subunit ClpC
MALATRWLRAKMFGLPEWDHELRMFERFTNLVRRVRVSGDGSSFEDLTDRARRVLVLAQEEARLLNHNFIGTEHILLGLIHEGGGVAAKALQPLGISLDAVRAKVEKTIGPAGSSTTGSPPFTPRAKKVLEPSRREALQLGHNYIGTEHLLLGLLREGEGVAAQVLTSLGADLARVRQQVIQILSGYQPADNGGTLPNSHLPMCAPTVGPCRAVASVWPA